MPTTAIPTIDLNDFTQGDAAARKAFIENLGKAYEEIGFIALKNHGLDEDLRGKLYQTVEQFFQLPEEAKMKYDGSHLAGQRGYTAKGKEHAKGRSVGDLKEFYHVGQVVAADDPEKDQYPDNIFPSEDVPEFEEVTLEAYRRLEDAGRELLRAIALYLGLDEFYFDDKIQNGDSILRPIHYFPIENPDEVPDGAVRAAAHEDINLITLLMGASADGLQVQNKQGKWIPVTVIPECVIINVGDMLQRLTNGKLVSTTHRVVNPPREKMGTSRLSIPFFLHPRKDMDLTALDSCVTYDNPKKFDDMTAGEYLNERLREIGLLK